MVERIQTLERVTNQKIDLSESSENTHAKMAFLHAMIAANDMRPTPYRRNTISKLAPEMVNTIADTAESLGKEYTDRLLKLSDKQESVFTDVFVRHIHGNSNIKLASIEQTGTTQATQHEHNEVHEQHLHNEEDERSTPIISRKWQAATIAGNALIGAAELASGGGTTLSVTADGIHNAGDAATYYLQTENILNPSLPEERIARRRKIAHTIIAALSLSVAVKAGYDLSFDEDISHNPTAIYSAGASLALNSLLMATLYRGINRRRKEGILTPHEKDLTKHLWAIDVPSAALAVGGAVAQKYGIDTVEPIAAVASGLVGAYAFRPTEKNLEHENCVKHDHAHHDHGHGHTTEPVDQQIVDDVLFGKHSSGIIKNREQVYKGRHHHKEHIPEHEIFTLPKPIAKKKRSQAIAAAALVAALGASASSSGKVEAVNASLLPSDAVVGMHAPERTMNNGFTFELPQPETQKELFAHAEVKKGDTQWGFVENAIESAEVTSSPALQNVLADITAYENKVAASNPDRIIPGQVLKVPSQTMIQEIQETLALPESNPSLATDLQELNDAPTMSKWEKIKKKLPVLKKIKEYFLGKYMNR